MSNVPDKSVFENIYAGKAPWDIGRPQQPFVDAIDRITGAVLDAGCGTGDTALFLAKHGRTVTGIDFLPGPIERAKRKAAEQNLSVRFLVHDALALADLGQSFDNAVDSGLFHVFTDDDRRAYVAQLARVLKSGGRLFVMCFSDAEPGPLGPRRVPKADLHAAFSQGWTVESIEAQRFAIQEDFKDSFSPGGPHSWFAVIRRD